MGGLEIFIRLLVGGTILGLTLAGAILYDEYRRKQINGD